MPVGNKPNRVFAPAYDRRGKRWLSEMTTGKNPTSGTLPERRLMAKVTGKPDVKFRGDRQRPKLSDSGERRGECANI